MAPWTSNQKHHHHYHYKPPKCIMLFAASCCSYRFSLIARGGITLWASIQWSSLLWLGIPFWNGSTTFQGRFLHCFMQLHLQIWWPNGKFRYDVVRYSGAKVKFTAFIGTSFCKSRPGFTCTRIEIIISKSTSFLAQMFLMNEVHLNGNNNNNWWLCWVVPAFDW